MQGNILTNRNHERAHYAAPHQKLTFVSSDSHLANKDNKYDPKRKKSV